MHRECGGVAQLGERLPCTQEVIGSIPFTSTTSGDRYQETGASRTRPLPGGNFQKVARTDGLMGGLNKHINSALRTSCLRALFRQRE